MAPSFLFSLDDEAAAPDRQLIEISLRAAKCALEIDMTEVSARFEEKYAKFINTWPGEHYKLLAGLVKSMAPCKVIEIGTYTGASFLAMKKYLSAGAVLITYDVIPWHEFKSTGLRLADFDGQHQQRLVDLSDKEAAKSQLPDLAEAELIFVDAEKDAEMEKRICQLFDDISFRTPPIVVFDDIRLVNMLKIWREIKHPKLDLTSWGHWSGTGIVKWN